MRLRVATYNLLAGGSARRAQHYAMIEQHIAPDILLTQECKRPDGAAVPRRTVIWSEAVKGRWGTGLLAAHAVVPIPVRSFRGWITGGELQDADRPLRVFSVHVPAGQGGYVNTARLMVKRLKPHARAADLIVGGDFNVAVGYRDPADQKMSAAERALLTELTEELDLMPCWQTAHPGEPLAQTLRWMRNPQTPYHCDGIFAPRSWRSYLTSCEVVSGPEWDRLSDHNPVVAEFALP